MNLRSRMFELPQDRDYIVTVRIGDPDTLTILRGDITRYPADAIVNAANSSLMGGGGVDGAIHRAGGPAILEECKKIRAQRGPLPAGQAVVTTAGHLPAKYVIHTVGPVWNGGSLDEAAVLASCYRESLRLADEMKLHSISFPAISTGAYGYPSESAAWVAIPTLIDAIRRAKSVVSAELVLFDRVTLNVFAEVAMAQRKPTSGKPYEILIGHD